MDLNPREENLEGYLRRRAAQRNWLVVKVGVDGWPDNAVIATDGVTGWLELKRWGEEPEPRQQLRIEELQARGHLAGWADTPRKVDRFLDQLMARELVHRRLGPCQ